MLIMQKKLYVYIFILAIFMVFSCRNTYKEEDLPASLTLAVGYIPNMQFAPLYVAITKGFFKEEHINLTVEYGVGNDVLSLLAAEKVNLTLADADQYLMAKAQGLPLQAIFQYYDTSPIAVITIDETIHKPADLRGKRIGVPELFGSSYLMLLDFFAHYTIDYQEVEIVRVGYMQMAALLAHEVDAVVVFANNEPLLLKNQLFSIWSSNEFSQLSGSLIVSNSLQRPFLEKKGLIEAFQRALIKGILFTCDYPEEAATISQKFISGIEYDDILAGIRSTIIFYSTNGIVNQQQLYYTEERLRTLSFLSK